MPDASYVIDIAAAMGGGEQTIAELDALVTGLTGAGKNAEFFQQAMVKVSAELEQAAAATEQANAALATGQDEYRQLEAAAVQSAKAAERAGLKYGVMSREYLQASSAASVASSALEEQAGTLADLERNAAAAAAEEDHLARTMGNVKRLSGHVDKSLGAQAEQLEKLGGALGAVGGPLGRLGQGLVQPVQGFTKLSAAMGMGKAAALLGVVAFAAVAAAIVAVGVAAAVAAVKVASWATSLADSKRNADLAIEAMQVMTPELAGLQDVIGDVADETGMNAGELNGMAKSLLTAGKSADQMEDSLRAAAYAQTALGQEGSAAYLKLVQDATDAQKAVDEAAKKGTVGKELKENLLEATIALGQFEHKAVTGLGGVVARQMLGLEAQSNRLKKNMGDTFGGLNIDPVLEGMKILVGLFDQNTVAGQTMKFLFETVFQPIIDQAKNAALVIEAFYLGFLIGGTKLYIALKPLIKAVSDFFGFEDSSLLNLLGGAKDIGEIVAVVFAGIAVVFGVVVAAVVAMGAAILALPAAFFLMINAVQQAGQAVGQWIVGAFNSAVEFIRSINFVEIGTNIMLGLASGITGAAGAVVGAITGAVRGAINSAKSLLGIASPSKVFEGFGDMTGLGFVEGVEAQNDNAQAAMSTLVEPPAPPAISVPTDAPGGASGAASSSSGAAAPATGGGPSFTFNAPITFNGVKDAPSGVAQLADMLTRVWEGDALTVGAGTEEDGSEAAA